MSNKKYIQLLEKYYTGQCSNKELFELFEWINSVDGSKEMDIYLSEQLKSFERIDRQLPDKTYRKVYKNIQSKIFPNKLTNTTFRSLWKYAVIVVPILSIVVFNQYLQNGTTQDVTTFSISKGNKGNMVLADGSRVMMNAESQISYSSEKKRDIRLDGEAYLEITRENNAPFTVHTPYLDIIVYGTAFNVIAYPGEPNVKISLVEGSVGLQIPGQSELTYIIPGQTALFNVRTRQIQLSNHNLNDIALWREEELALTDVDINTLSRKLQSWYGVEIHLTNQPQRKHLYNMKLRHEPIEDILKLINEVTPIAYHIEGKEVTLGYK